jgi:high affinity Mn2+ porin
MRAPWVVVCLLAAAAPARADDPDGNGVDDDRYLITHPATRWWLSGQMNVVTQAQPGFHSPYQGDNSLRPDDHRATSLVATVYAAYELTPYTAVMIAGEMAAGGGLSTALGVAGFTNLDVVRNPSLGPTPYVGRALIDQVIPLSDERVVAERLPFDVLRRLPSRRIEIRAGKLSTVDMFDTNDVATDSHRQLLNWAIDNNGAYDYAADTRGYTLGAIVEYAEPLWAIRFGDMLMPTVANGIDYDFDLAHAHSENLELEIHDCLAGHPGFVKVLGFLNHAKMGKYDEAIAEYRSGITDPPDIVLTRVAGRTKYGFGLNVQQEVAADVRAAARLGWSDGVNESFAYTEIDNTFQVALDTRGGRWRRPHDQLGVAVVTNGLSMPHRTYLSLGGKGFLLGDGRLSYGRENIVEAYYTAQLYRGVFPAVDVQLIDNPGYNRDRGPVAVLSLRLHLEI